VTRDAFGAMGWAYAADVSSERLPARVAPRVVEVVHPSRSVAELQQQIDSIRTIAAQPVSKWLRRVVFMWFRVYVHEQKHGKHERVNVRIPIPIPIVGALFPLGLARQKALKALAVIEDADEPTQAVTDYLDSVMGFEFVRVEESKGPDNKSLVVVGFD
jgi:hypothetical protein